MILIIYAHPYPQHSHANKRMLEQAGTLEGVEIRSLYQLYPDFNIDVAAEQAALARADLVIWQHPMQWYSVPPLLKLWMDKVLSHGWAYGHNGIALRGKSLMWAVTYIGVIVFVGLTAYDTQKLKNIGAGNRALLRDEMAAAVRYALHLYLR
jgi:putative NADPH-quinone reductase